MANIYLSQICASYRNTIVLGVGKLQLYNMYSTNGFISGIAQEHHFQGYQPILQDFLHRQVRYTYSYSYYDQPARSPDLSLFWPRTAYTYRCGDLFRSLFTFLPIVNRSFSSWFCLCLNRPVVCSAIYTYRQAYINSYSYRYRYVYGGNYDFIRQIVRPSSSN